MTAALDALARLDFDTVLPEDAAVLAVFERHCQLGAFEPPVDCRHGVTGDCNSCFLDYDQALRRAEDI